MGGTFFFSVTSKCRADDAMSLDFDTTNKWFHTNVAKPPVPFPSVKKCPIQERAPKSRRIFGAFFLRKFGARNRSALLTSFCMRGSKVIAILFGILHRYSALFQLKTKLSTSTIAALFSTMALTSQRIAVVEMGLARFSSVSVSSLALKILFSCCLGGGGSSRFFSAPCVCPSPEGSKQDLPIFKGGGDLNSIPSKWTRRVWVADCC